MGKISCGIILRSKYWYFKLFVYSSNGINGYNFKANIWAVKSKMNNKLIK